MGCYVQSPTSFSPLGLTAGGLKRTQGLPLLSGLHLIVHSGDYGERPSAAVESTLRVHRVVRCDLECSLSSCSLRLVEMALQHCSHIRTPDHWSSRRFLGCSFPRHSDTP